MKLFEPQAKDDVNNGNEHVQLSDDEATPSNTDIHDVTINQEVLS